ncbi:TRAP transporter-DctP subunit [Alloalcanivorax dieselolei B5]|uniref:TRAP transporter-DctP subunit n=1 Tax=Alcanivorax dieselolei (strain DSM 16502 / CGMCC 1.3690 / MCCC 1A00001 / B-5) TaxID=930169 RepID=K0CFJ8_ALCDB|nr:TRAP transporter substrate-binding protein [Alloalcanivorax dieselolei]AFT71125.1 TRAP transporter-DctP subunit [Alloalcanivorax dieselolei B5]
MNKTRFGCRALMCLLLVVLTSVAGARELKLGLIVPGSHAWSKAAETFGEDLEKQSGGEYSVAVFPAGQLGSEAQMLQQLQTGALDMAFMTAAEVANRVPDLGALFAPYLAENVMEADRLLNGPTAQALLEELPRKAGVVGLGYGVAGMRLMLTAFPAEDVQGINDHKIRITPFPPVQDFYRLLGAVSTPMPVTDVYDALANGQVDGVDADLELVWKLRLYERAKTVLRSNHMMFPVVGLISARTWSQLDQDDRDLIRTLTRKRLAELAPYYQKSQAETQAQIEAKNVKVIEVGLDFFGDKLDQWEELWMKKTPVLGELRGEAAEL